ncbi:MAG: class I SAM-dependent methyltransferase [Clostridia bacterium]|nr:class I SAM-dependent methyltransferase [Clostridia bacterium]
MSYWEEKNQHPDPDAYDGWLDKYAGRLSADVLDLGCGRGVNLPSLLKFGARVTAADLSRTAVQDVWSLYGCRLRGTDCLDMRDGLPYADEAFDVVVADLSLHYFTWEETLRIIADIRRVLRPEGFLIARVHSMANLDRSNAEEIEPGYYVAYGYPRRYFTLEEIRALFGGWRSCEAGETVAYRFGRTKQVIELEACK